MWNSIFSAFLGALIGAVVPFLTLRYNYKDLFAKTVSSNRMEWINNFREELATVVAALKYSDIKKMETNEKESYIYSAEKARAKLLTRINLDTSKNGNEYNQVFSEILSSVDFYDTNSKDKAEPLMALSRKILEIEWKRVKREAGGKGR